jgi:hypothetical protein
MEGFRVKGLGKVRIAGARVCTSLPTRQDRDREGWEGGRDIRSLARVCVCVSVCLCVCVPQCVCVSDVIEPVSMLRSQLQGCQVCRMCSPSM